jgi:hypothetical protein
MVLRTCFSLMIGHAVNHILKSLVGGPDMEYVQYGPTCQLSWPHQNCLAAFGLREILDV